MIYIYMLYIYIKINFDINIISIFILYTVLYIYMYLLLYTADKISHDPNWTRQLLLEVWHSWRLGFRLRICRSAHKNGDLGSGKNDCFTHITSYCGLYDYCYYYMGLLWDYYCHCYMTI